MKAISLWQPWASLWCSPRKVHETRHWKTPHRGRLLVHAAKRFEKDHPTELADILRAEFGANWFRDLPRGALIGTVTLLDCERTEDIYSDYSFPDATKEDTENYYCGDFSEGRFGWKRGAYELFKTPIPYRGQQAMFDVPDELLENLLGVNA